MTDPTLHLHRFHAAYLDGPLVLLESIGRAWLRGQALMTIGRSVAVEEWAEVLGSELAAEFDTRAARDRARVGRPDVSYRKWRSTVLAPLVRARAGQPVDVTPYREFVHAGMRMIAGACGMEPPPTLPHPWRVGRDVARRTEVRFIAPLAKVTAATVDLSVEADVRWADTPRNTIRQFQLTECCWPHRITVDLDDGVWVSSTGDGPALAGPELLDDALERFSRLVGLVSDEPGRQAACRYLDQLAAVSKAWRDDVGH